MPPRARLLSGAALLATGVVLTGGCTGGAPHPQTTVTARAAHPRAGHLAPPRPGPVPAPSVAHEASQHAEPPAVRQVIKVTAASYGATYATLTAYQTSGHGWRRVFGPWTARIGRNGFAPPGGKREGDGSTPSGSFNMLYIFGIQPNPGFHFPYRQIHPYDYWDDDPASPRYNEWVDSRRDSPGANPEPMDVSAYYDGVAIGYNTARTPGLGSAIFLHLNIGIATAGCLTLPPDELLPLLRWLNPARAPRIKMGVR